MSELEQQLRAVADSAPPVTTEEVTRRVARRRGIVAGLGAAACVPFALIGVTVLRHGDDGLNVVANSPTTTSTTIETPDPTSADAGVITRPLIEMEGCEPIDAHEGAGVVDQTFTYRLTESSTTQLIAVGELNPDRYAVVQRHPAVRFPRDDGSHVTEDRVGEGWRHPDDGSEIYVRSRGLADVELALLMEHLVARPTTDPIPGVDIEVTALDAVIVDEAVGTLEIEVSGSRCEAGDGALRFASLLTGPDVAQFAVALDRPAPFDLRRQSDGSLLVAWGAGDPSGLLELVVDVDEDTWEELRRG